MKKIITLFATLAIGSVGGWLLLSNEGTSADNMPYSQMVTVKPSTVSDASP